MQSSAKKKHDRLSFWLHFDSKVLIVVMHDTNFRKFKVTSILFHGLQLFPFTLHQKGKAQSNIFVL
jgi:hypothetical protein